MPSDAAIIFGQNTSTITVNWGTSDGNISLNMNIEGNDTLLIHTIKTVLVPEGSGITFLNFDDGVTDSIRLPENTVNSYDISEENGSLKIIYNTIDAGDNSYFELIPERPENMSNHQEFAIDIKTQNLSNSAIMRIDLIDTDGHITDYSPVFNLFEINKDGNFHEYSRNFDTHWLTSTPYGRSVDKNRIRAFRIYVNFGFFWKRQQERLNLD